MTLHVKKALAAVVICGCLSLQTFEIVRPSSVSWSGRLWPFIDYPMFSRSFQPGAIARVSELRGVACGASSGVRRIAASDIGQPEFRLRGRLSTITADGDIALYQRRLLNHIVASEIVPRPCELQIWERTVTLSNNGVDPVEFTQPRWTMRRAWALEGLK